MLTVGAVIAAVATLDMTTWFIWPHGALQQRIGVLGALLQCVRGRRRYRGPALPALRRRRRDRAHAGLRHADAAAGRPYAVTTLALATALGSGSPWATAGATLVVAVAFRPLRSALQDLVDRRFRRARYEAVRRVGAFLDELRAGAAAPEAIEPLLRELLSDPTLELRFFLPESQVYVDTRGMPVTDVAGDARVCAPIERAGVPVALVLHRATGPQRPDPLTTLVEAGGLAIEIARLRVELRRQLAEVEASRARIVAAGDAERRRIERDLHDGAQQRLVSIGLALRHAQHQLTGTAPSHADQTLDHAVAELAAGDRGAARVWPGACHRRSSTPGWRRPFTSWPPAPRCPSRSARRDERFASTVEAAAYFIACEGLTNAIKHAHANGRHRERAAPRRPPGRQHRRRRGRRRHPHERLRSARPARSRRRPRRAGCASTAPPTSGRP